MFFKVEPSAIYLAQGATDLRKSINGLSAIVRSHFQLNPFDHNLYVFCNGRRNRLKVLQWDGTGFWVYYKALSRGKFPWIDQDDGVLEIEASELEFLTHGLRLQGKHRPVMRSY